MVVRVIALGNRHASDDGAALRAADALEGQQVVPAGRPGAGLLDLLAAEGPIVLVDVIRSGAAPGSIVQLSLSELARAAVSGAPVSSHGFGAGEALELGHALGRPLPDGCFVGIEGSRFEPGDRLSPPVEAALPALVAALREAVRKATRGIAEELRGAAGRYGA